MSFLGYYFTQKELDIKIKEATAQLQADLVTSNVQVGTLTKNLAAANKKVSDQNTTNARLQSENTKLKAQVSTLQAEILKLQREANDFNTQMSLLHVKKP